MTDNEKFLARSWYILLFMLGAMLAIVGYALWTHTIPEENRSQAFTIVGLIMAKFGDVIAWRINSSKGSSDKSNPPGSTTTTVITPTPEINK